MEEKGGSEIQVLATTGLTGDWEAGTEEAFTRGGTVEGDGNFQAMAATENGIDREGCGRRCWAWTQGRWTRRGCQETGKEGAGGSASAASRRKQRRRARSTAATASWEAGTPRLIKTKTRPMATEKSEGHEDPHVVGDGKEEEGERETAAAMKFAEDPATASRRRKAVGFAVTIVKEEKATADGGGRRGEGEETGGSQVEERERREEKPGLTASKGRSGGRRRCSASKNGDAGARRDNGGMAHHLLNVILTN